MKATPSSGWSVGGLLLLVFLGLARLTVDVSAQPAPTVVWQGAATNTYIINCVGLSPDGTVAATLGTNNTIQIWQMSDGTPLLSLTGNGLWVGALVFSPDGKHLAAGGGDDIVRVWRTADWSLAYYVSTTQQGPPVAFSPDSSTLAVGNGASIELRYATNGVLFQSWTGISGQLAALAFSPDGTKIASGAGFRGEDTALKLWSVPGGTPVWSAPTAQTYGIGGITFSPDGQQVVTGGEFFSSGPVQSWRVADGSLLRNFPGPAYATVFSADGMVLAATGTNLMFFRVSDGATIQQYVDNFPGNIGEGPRGIALTTGGRFIRARGKGQVLVGYVPVLASSPGFASGKLILQWVGGTGSYQLQSSSPLGSGWQNVGGVMTTNETSIMPDGTSGFYQIESLTP